MLDAMVWACIILAFLIAFSIGANDAANALGTSYGSGALPLIYLVLIGGLFEFIGAFWCSGKVAGTLA
jgi:phosphate/sulfate permease